ncbi:MAG: phage holin family protein [Acidobacteriota bacterium]|nr:phage holin family protein [Acidobacteriota bacterium]
MAGGWVPLFRSLGQSLLAVFQAEVAVLGEDFKRSGRHLGVGAALVGAAAAISFWVAGLLLFVLVAVLSLWLETWAAALIVCAFFGLVAGILLYLGFRQLRQLASPLADIRRRAADHLEWWRNRLLAEPLEAVEAARATADPLNPENPRTPLDGDL